MPNSTSQRTLLTTGFILILLSGLGFGAYRAYQNPKPPRILDTFGNQQIDTVDASGKPTVITQIHTVPDFVFTDQLGQTVNQQTTAGKTYVADFFFTTCESICPVMSKEIMRLCKELKDDTSVVFISHTVDPETDSVPQLLTYAKTHQANPRQWHFVTGPKTDLYAMARQGYYVTATEGDGGADDFVHTQNFVLVDKYRQIRGYYDGTVREEMDKLLKDIQLLKAEYAWRDAGGK